MSHPDDLTLSMYVDSALLDDEITQIGDHIKACEVCTARAAAMQMESQYISAGIAQEAESLQQITVPKFSRPTSLRDFAIANIVTALIIGLAQFLWKTIFGELVMNAAGWATSIYAPDIYEVSVATTLYYLEEGTAMLDAYFGFVVLILTVLTVAGLALMYRKSQAMFSLCALVVIGGAIALPEPVHALEILRDESSVTVAADEVIDDTLIAAAEAVVIKGDVTGNLIAVGQTVDIQGDVGGNVISFAENISIQGSVGGMVLGAGSRLDLMGADVATDLWAAGDKINVDATSSIGKNATIAGQSASIEAPVGSDFYAFAESAEVNGVIAGTFEAFANRVRLMDNAHIQGDTKLHVRSEDALVRAAGARTDGVVEFLDLPEEFEPENPYATIEFYLWLVVQLVMALLVGLAMYWLWPGLRRASLGSGIEALKTTGIGLIALVSLPIVALIIAITLVGLPFAFATIVGWVALIYLAKIIVGGFIGQRLLSGGKHEHNVVLALLVGMAIVIAATNIPILGEVISFVFTIIGIGLILQQIFAFFSERSAV